MREEELLEEYVDACVQARNRPKGKEQRVYSSVIQQAVDLTSKYEMMLENCCSACPLKAAAAMETMGNLLAYSPAEKRNDRVNELGKIISTISAQRNEREASLLKNYLSEFSIICTPQYSGRCAGKNLTERQEHRKLLRYHLQISDSELEYDFVHVD